MTYFTDRVEKTCPTLQRSLLL